MNTTNFHKIHENYMGRNTASYNWKRQRKEKMKRGLWNLKFLLKAAGWENSTGATCYEKRSSTQKTKPRTMETYSQGLSSNQETSNLGSAGF